MISVWHLAWIVPLCVTVGVMIAAIVSANDDDWRPKT